MSVDRSTIAKDAHSRFPAFRASCTIFLVALERSASGGTDMAVGVNVGT